MSVGRVAAARWPRITRTLGNWAGGWNRVGEQLVFHAKTLAGIREAVLHYRIELLRVLAQMSLGVGALAAIGGALVVVTFLVMSTGAVVGATGTWLAGFGTREDLEDDLVAMIASLVRRPDRST